MCRVLLFFQASPWLQKAKAQTKTKYLIRRCLALTEHLDQVNTYFLLQILLLQHIPYHCRHTKLEYGAPTKAAVKYTSLEYCASIGNRFCSSFPVQTVSRLIQPLLSQVLPTIQPPRTTGRLSTVQ